MWVELQLGCDITTASDGTHFLYENVVINTNDIRIILPRGADHCTLIYCNGDRDVVKHCYAQIRGILQPYEAA